MVKEVHPAKDEHSNFLIPEGIFKVVKEEHPLKQKGEIVYGFLLYPIFSLNTNEVKLTQF